MKCKFESRNLKKGDNIFREEDIHIFIKENLNKMNDVKTVKWEVTNRYSQRRDIVVVKKVKDKEFVIAIEVMKDYFFTKHLDYFKSEIKSFKKKYYEIALVSYKEVPQKIKNDFKNLIEKNNCSGYIVEFLNNKINIDNFINKVCGEVLLLEEYLKREPNENLVKILDFLYEKTGYKNFGKSFCNNYSSNGLGVDGLTLDIRTQSIKVNISNLKSINTKEGVVSVNKFKNLIENNTSFKISKKGNLAIFYQDFWSIKEKILEDVLFLFEILNLKS